MSYVQNIFSDLRDRRLWPVALALVVALVAIPLLLSSGGGSSSGTPTAQIPPVATPAQNPALPVVSVTTTPSHVKLTGKARNPFAPQHQASTPGSHGSGSPSSGSTAHPATASPAAVSHAAGATSTASSSPSPAPAPVQTIPAHTFTPAPPGLSPTQSYDVTFAMTNTSGGFDTINSLERLSPLPSNQQPWLVELGVLKGGHRVLFAVQPGSVVTGPGNCAPGPIDCEVLSLAPNQDEELFLRMPGGLVPVTLFAVTGITAADHSSAAAADKARHASSAEGRRLMNNSTLSALSLFQYQPSLGAVVDLRNLTIGGGS